MLKKITILKALLLAVIMTSPMAQDKASCDRENYQDYIFDKTRMHNLVENTGQGCNLSNTKLSRIMNIRTYLRKSNLNNSDLSNSYLNRADLENATLKNAKLRGSIMTGADLDNADFTGADLEHVILHDADMDGTVLDRANLNRARLRGTDLSNVKSMKSSSLIRADLEDAILKNAKLRGSDMTGADLDNADFTGADLRNVTLKDTDMDGTVLDKANLTKADLRGVDLSNVKKLESANLSDALYDETTVWPKGFKVAEGRMILRRAGSIVCPGATMTASGNQIICDDGRIYQLQSRKPQESEAEETSLWNRIMRKGGSKSRGL